MVAALFVAGQRCSRSPLIARFGNGESLSKDLTLIGEYPTQTTDPDSDTNTDTPIDSGPDATVQGRRGVRIDRVYRD